MRYRLGKPLEETLHNCCSRDNAELLEHDTVQSKNVVGFSNQRGTAEQWIKEGKGAIEGTRLSCRSFNANMVRLQLHALAYKPRELPTHARNA